MSSSEDVTDALRRHPAARGPEDGAEPKEVHAPAAAAPPPPSLTALTCVLRDSALRTICSGVGEAQRGHGDGQAHPGTVGELQGCGRTLAEICRSAILQGRCLHILTADST
ncbi:hypothetical protein MATL_G00079630 [Megalops atlanticus]|uniref:Uncharacterized protein n=1 Tax=Megalops atlanticus TaxID=7932 RepID=A0A9D3TCQ8_MEGAT|nr:hypothetical protein MATL_G00079630 [Megalops atlanticus]